MLTRKEKLKELGWTIYANLHNCAFVVETDQGDRRVLYFYRDGLDYTPMVNVYFASSFTGFLLDKLHDSPHEFLETFYGYCTSNIPDWCIKEELFFQIDKESKEKEEIRTSAKN